MERIEEVHELDPARPERDGTMVLLERDPAESGEPDEPWWPLWTTLAEAHLCFVASTRAIDRDRTRGTLAAWGRYIASEILTVTGKAAHYEGRTQHEKNRAAWRIFRSYSEGLEKYTSRRWTQFTAELAALSTPETWPAQVDQQSLLLWDAAVTHIAEKSMAAEWADGHAEVAGRVETKRKRRSSTTMVIAKPTERDDADDPLWWDSTDDVGGALAPLAGTLFEVANSILSGATLRPFESATLAHAGNGWDVTPTLESGYRDRRAEKRLFMWSATLEIAVSFTREGLNVLDREYLDLHREATRDLGIPRDERPIFTSLARALWAAQSRVYRRLEPAGNLEPARYDST
jgi:hypothetical protein